MEIKENDLVICVVKKIESGSVFVELENKQTGSIVLPEIAAGRIRNLRDYVSVNRKIVCKVLRISSNNIELSLRRVTKKEKEEVLEAKQREQNLKSLIKNLSTNSEQILKNIEKEYPLSDFYEEIQENIEIAKKYFNNEEFEKLKKAVSEKGGKNKQVKKIFVLRSINPNGIEEIKEILSKVKSEVKYLGSSRFSIINSAKDYKSAEKTLKEELKKIEEDSKKLKITFEFIEK
jgi:translation initiation factor 2 alpha subunit (eIF-2alpha)